MVPLETVRSSRRVKEEQLLRSKFVRLICVIAVSALVSGACGGSERVEASSFMKDVCTSVNDWVTSIQERGGNLGSELTGEPSQAKEKLDEFLGQAVEATDTLIAAIDEAGIPDVDGGEDIADALKKTFETAKKALEDAQAQVADLPEDDPAAFSEQSTALGTDIQTAMGDLGATLGDAPEELTKAAEDEPACQQLGG
ncbi:MAG: hypothetical protein ABI571_07990 [Actinomycetota bacterium]